MARKNHAVDHKAGPLAIIAHWVANCATINFFRYFRAQSGNGEFSTSELQIFESAVPPTISIRTLRSNLQLTWSQGVLLEATNITEPSSALRLTQSHRTARRSSIVPDCHETTSSIAIVIRDA